MPQAGQQEYKVIAPKEGRQFPAEAAALAELKKSILNGIGFGCLIKDTLGDNDDINRVIGFYLNGDSATVFSHENGDIMNIGLSYTVTQYQGLAAVQNAIDEEVALQYKLPALTKGQDGVHLSDDNTEVFICVDGKYLTVTGSKTIEALAIAEDGPTGNFINITWEDAQKLIGLPLV